MVSKRQREARKRFREANPDLFPKPEPAKESSSKKKKKKKGKASPKGETISHKKKSGGSSSTRKHPLRVPGMRPGESCFICKSMDHIAKLCPEKSHWEKNKICLFCRQRGHSLKHCPEKSDVVGKKFCYNCGDVGHALFKCPSPLQAGGTKFANCFICNERGHLSKNCPKNTHGIYPKGGSCKICGGVTHLAKDCPNKGNQHSFFSPAGKLEERAQGQWTVFHSGDDLEDDFMVEDIKSSKQDAISYSNIKPAAAEGVVEQNNRVTKKKQGPKVVNFLG